VASTQQAPPPRSTASPGAPVPVADTPAHMLQQRLAHLFATRHRNRAAAAAPASDAAAGSLLPPRTNVVPLLPSGAGAPGRTLFADLDRWYPVAAPASSPLLRSIVDGLRASPAATAVHALRTRLESLAIPVALAEMGLPVAQVAHSLLRSAIMIRRQDVAQVKQQVAVAMKEVAAIEYDVAGSRNGAFGSDGASGRGMGGEGGGGGRAGCRVSGRARHGIPQ
jgi:hypothetical protein